LLPLPVEPFRYCLYGERTVHLDGSSEINSTPYFTTVYYAGPAALEIAGLSQINLQIPSFMLSYPGPLIVWFTLPDGTTVTSNPVYVYITA
jgi:hypothetical protein